MFRSTLFRYEGLFTIHGSHPSSFSAHMKKRQNTVILSYLSQPYIDINHCYFSIIFRTFILINYT